VAVTLAWRQVIQSGWCWNRDRITLLGPTRHRAWKASGYCWSNTYFARDPWSGHPGRWWEYRVLDQASLHVTIPFIGCDRVPLADSFRTLKPVEFIRRGGGYNFG